MSERSEDLPNSLKQAYELLFGGQTQLAQVRFELLHNQHPEHPDVWNGLGLLAEQGGDLQMAQSHYQEALRLNPNEPEYHNNLALLLQSQGQDMLALAHFEKLFELQPDSRSAFNLSQVYMRLGHNQKANETLKTALWREPEAIYLHQQLFSLYQIQNSQSEGVLWYQQLLRRHSNSGETSYFLACLYEAIKENTKANEYLQTTQQLLPNWSLPRRQMLLLNLKSDYFLALKHCRQLYQMTPSPEHLLLLLNVLPYPVYASRQEQAENLAEIESLLDTALQEVWEVPNFRLITMHFYLAYQNGNDRVWNEKFHSLYRRLIPTLPPLLERPAGKIKRIGIVSRFLFRHSVSFCFGGLFASLAALENTELVFFPIYESRLSADPVSKQFQDLAREWIPLALESPVLEAAQKIQAAQLDLLIYPEIGMDPFTYMLAHHRFAPHQIVLAGHPLTSGLSSIDYFVTSQALEIPGCESHYTEQWVGLPGLIEYQRSASLWQQKKQPKGLSLSGHKEYPSPSAQQLSRAQLGLPETGTLYLCPMTLFKIHPDLDLCFAEILRQDPQGWIVLFEYLQTPYHLVLKHRFATCMPEVSERIVFLPFQSFEGFLAILAQADIVLDTHYFGGGNTSFLAFDLGIPVVTWPSDYLKARSTQGLYLQMGLASGVATGPQDYIQKALDWGLDPAWRREFSQQILQKNHLIFEQRDWNQAFVDFCQKLLSASD
jgi:protein O-GlcNAc transferase